MYSYWRGSKLLVKEKKTPIRVLQKNFFALGWIYGYQTNQYGPQSSQKKFERNRIKNKPSRAQNVQIFVVFRLIFWGFWAPKGLIFAELTPLLVYMINITILHITVKFGCCRYKIVDFRLKKPYFLGFFGDNSKSHFSPPKFTEIDTSFLAFNIF